MRLPVGSVVLSQVFQRKRRCRTLSTYAVALLEILVHANLGRVPHGFAYIEIDFPAGVAIEEVTASGLPNWDAVDCGASQKFGSEWYQEKRSAVLVVPSVAAGGMERNVVINPEHGEFRLVKASRPRQVEWDQRLFGRGKASHCGAAELTDRLGRWCLHRQKKLHGLV
jgi:hypothetical protein